MKYLIMFIIVCGEAGADFLTGFLKACCKGEKSSKAMRIGGLHKFAEIIVMGTAIGLTIGFDYLGQYYSDSRLADIAGNFTALSVFVYITLMEIISILENFAEINPQAKKWIEGIIKNLGKGE